ncbi:flagellar hook-associated protein FlgK [Sphingomonas fennica]|uniref:Flagellar hook-associated protein 1 n=1 Tax=Edaphosphingomonas fennica TaxID=114404 RepID=A0A2T4HPG2_9SPHN|nr:flagellar hook-associated protein FlgK [Sphingomonas fennica]PTD17694.1 flagellar hook-associated protein FlgK [Sphingomonas fennica]
MSLNDILNTAVSGLSASQAAMRTVSNNIANVNTPGYAREKVAASSTVSGGRTSGVYVSEPSRVADKFLESTVYNRSAGAGWAKTASSYFDQLESLLGGVGSTTGLAARLAAVSSSATQMSSLEATPQSIATFTGNVDDMLDLLKQLRGDTNGLQANVESEVNYTVDRTNTLLKQIHTLNDSVAQRRALGQSTSGIENERAAAIEELSGLMKVTVREQPDGRMMIEADSGQVLLDRRLRQLSYNSGPGAAQPLYSAIDIRFANNDGTLGASTGQKIDSSAIGGTLGSLIDLRDNVLPAYSGQVGDLFSALAEGLNAAANAGTTVPAPASLQGRQTGLAGTDRLGFTGAASFAVMGADGTLLAKVDVDFDALGPTATVDDAVAAINAGLAGFATASFVNGRLSIAADAAPNGVAVAQAEANPASRAGVGFSHYFGLNDVIRSDSGAITPSGFTAADPAGFGAGETAEVVLRDAAGRPMASYTYTATGGETFGDVIAQLNASPLSGYGSFALDDRGRIQFTPNASSAGASITIPADSTSRNGSGLSFSDLAGKSAVDGAFIRPDILDNTANLPLARLNLGAAIGEKAIGPGDFRGAGGFVDSLTKAIDLGNKGKASVDAITSQFIAGIATKSAQSQTNLDAASARLSDAVGRRDNFAGVNIDEELAQMVVLQNSYSAAARVMTTASSMYDTLLEMVG